MPLCAPTINSITNIYTYCTANTYIFT